MSCQRCKPSYTGEYKYFYRSQFFGRIGGQRVCQAISYASLCGWLFQHCSAPVFPRLARRGDAIRFVLYRPRFGSRRRFASQVRFQCAKPGIVQRAAAICPLDHQERCLARPCIDDAGWRHHRKWLRDRRALLLRPNFRSEPYGIYANSPARLIRFRFSEKVSAALLEMAWWEMPLTLLNKTMTTSCLT